MIRVYLDNCCFNRPYDEQTQVKIKLETEAKQYIQDLIKDNRLVVKLKNCHGELVESMTLLI